MSLGLLVRALALAAASASARAQSADSVVLAVKPAGAGTWTFEVTADARRVELSGDLTNWDPRVLRAAGRRTFAVRLRAAPGIHQVAVRLDGGAWRVPTGLATVTDEFGGVAGVVSISRSPHDSGDARAKRGSPSRDKDGF